MRSRAGNGCPLTSEDLGEHTTTDAIWTRRNPIVYFGLLESQEHHESQIVREIVTESEPSRLNHGYIHTRDTGYKSTDASHKQLRMQTLFDGAITSSNAGGALLSSSRCCFVAVLYCTMVASQIVTSFVPGRFCQPPPLHFLLRCTALWRERVSERAGERAREGVSKVHLSSASTAPLFTCGRLHRECGSARGGCVLRTSCAALESRRHLG